MFTSLRTSFLSSLLLGALVSAGCGSASAPGSASLVDRTTRPLSIGSILELNGSYDPACLQRQGQSWSLGLPDAQSLTHDPLSVVLGDSGCTLYLTSFRVGTPAVSQLFLPPAPVPLSASFLALGVPFRLDPQEPVAFYANLRILPDASFQGPFTVQALYSEDVQAASLQLGPTGASAISAQLTAGGVPAPDYQAFSGLAIQTDAQAHVQSVMGYVRLAQQMVAGQAWVLEGGQLGEAPSYGELDAAYLAGAPTPISEDEVKVPAESFALVGQSLAAPVVRNLIVMHEEAGTRSYQLIRITFVQ